MLLELCVSTPVDVAVAVEAGADRVELCGHWECGGLTPTNASLRASINMGIPVSALIRPRAGHFIYNASERQLILAEALDCLDVGADKVVVGGLTEHGDIDEELLELLLSRVEAERLVFHRALDLSLDPLASAELLLDYGVNEVLTSGAAPAAGLGIELISGLVDLGLHVIAGGGVRPTDVMNLGEVGVSTIHASCRVKELPDDVSSAELFDLSVHPLDFEKASVLSEALKDWNE
jgi:copper homeostasis protein|tara:strand:- start:898 stop:1602 length:705 start_codon:yes stop_codon:yes gene_type:complete